jgi:mannose/cellobiose epimerase-like protein (N-acyl-D-glucosamine 2-epimerase family)
MALEPRNNSIDGGVVTVYARALEWKRMLRACERRQMKYIDLRRKAKRKFRVTVRDSSDEKENGACGTGFEI